MKIRIYVHKVLAMKAGKDEYGRITVPVPAASLSPEQREILARFSVPKYSRDEEAGVDFYLDDASPYKPTEATPKTVKAAIDAIIEQRKAEAEEKKQRHEESVKKWLAAPTEEMVTERYCGNVLAARVKERGVQVHMIPIDSRLDEKIVQAQAYAEQRNAAFEQERQQQRDEQEAKVRQLETAMRVWSDNNGSELLKARIMDGFEWKSLAEREFVDFTLRQMGLSEVQGSVDPGNGYEHTFTKERTTPTLDEIELLRHLRDKAEGLPVHLTLNWVRFDRKKGGTHIQRSEVEMEITAPSGRTMDVHYTVKDLQAAVPV